VPLPYEIGADLGRADAGFTLAELIVVMMILASGGHRGAPDDRRAEMQSNRPPAC